MPQNPLNKLISSTPQLWKGHRRNHSQCSLPTGHVRLDKRLPGKGWPLGAITELISHKPGLGEFSLLFPALTEMGQRGQWLILVDPPWIPYPASLHGRGLPLERLLLIRTQSEKESLWACEQALRGNRGGAVLAWPAQISFARLRRLQLAAEENGKLAFLFRPEQAAQTGSPAALRLQLQAGSEQGMSITVLKCRGSRPVEPIWVKPAWGEGFKHGEFFLGGIAENGRPRGGLLQGGMAEDGGLLQSTIN
jgi:cell division inhibitor SulA/protein ImuA